MSKLSTRLIELQESRELLKKDIAKAVGISTMAYYRYEQGLREPDANTLRLMADYFNVSVDYLLGRTDDPKLHTLDEK